MSMEKLPGGMGTSDGDFGQYSPRRFGGGYEKPGVAGGWNQPLHFKGSPGRYDPTYTKPRGRGEKTPLDKYKDRRPKPKKRKPIPRPKIPGRSPFPKIPYRPPSPGLGFNFSPFGPLDPRDWPGNEFWGTPPRLTSPAGYEFPTLPPPDYHWGPYDCGTPDMDNPYRRRQDTGWLSPPEDFACVAGQPDNGAGPVHYGDDWSIPGGTNLRRSISIGPQNVMEVPPELRRMRVVEHWGWVETNGTPPEPTPVNYKKPGSGPTPGWKPMPVDPKYDPDPKKRFKPGPAFDPPGGDPPKDPPPPPYKPPYVGPDGHVNLPPNLPGKKWKVPKNPWGDVYGILTELGDYMDCLEKAFYGRTHKQRPSGRYIPLQERLLMLGIDLYRNPDRMWWEGAVACMVINGAEDRAIAKFGDLASEIAQSPYWKRPVGPDFGGWKSRGPDIGPISYK